MHLCGLPKIEFKTKEDPFPLPFLDSILDIVAGHEMYSFMDGYISYNQVKMLEEDKKKTSFIFEWGTYAYNVMPFGLSNAPTLVEIGQNVTIIVATTCDY